MTHHMRRPGGSRITSPDDPMALPSAVPVPCALHEASAFPRAVKAREQFRLPVAAAGVMLRAGLAVPGWCVHDYAVALAATCRSFHTRTPGIFCVPFVALAHWFSAVRLTVR